MYKPTTYNDIIKKYGEDLTPVEKALNYRFYHDPFWDVESRRFIDVNGKVLRLCKEQRDSITFDSLKELVRLKMKFEDRNFEMLREKCVYNKTYKELAQKNHISSTSVQAQIRKIAKSIFNGKTLDIDNIKRYLSDYNISYTNEIYIRINTNNKVNENDTSIGNLGLTTRTYNCLLLRMRIEDLKELEGMNYSELLKCRTLGKKTFEEIQDVCKKYNINLVNDVDEEAKDFDKNEAIIRMQKDRIKQLEKSNAILIRYARKLEYTCQRQYEIIKNLNDK